MCDLIVFWVHYMNILNSDGLQFRRFRPAPFYSTHQIFSIMQI